MPANHFSKIRKSQIYYRDFVEFAYVVIFIIQFLIIFKEWFDNISIF